MNDAELQVISDRLREVEEPEDAEQLILWLKYPGAVRLLTRGIRCRCDTCMSAHDPGCWTMEAMRVIKHPAYAQQLERQQSLIEHHHAAALWEEMCRQMTPEQRAAASQRDAAAVSVFLRGVIRSPLGGDTYEAEVETLTSAGWTADDGASGYP